ncbi:MAG: GNAT family N-acetyltransferase [Thermomicrobiales bacterium]
MDVLIRRATEADLETAYEVQNEASAAAGLAIGNVGDTEAGLVPAKFRHECRHGRFLVAEVDGRIEGFGAVFERENIAFLATFYVRPGSQAEGRRIGQRLLDALFDVPASVHCVVSSHVHRALAIYARNGMLPRWPLFMIEARSQDLSFSCADGYSVEPADPDDPALVEWDRAIAGRGRRSEDQQYWLDEYSALPYWILRGESPVGYGYVQKLYESADATWHPETAMIGPFGVRESPDAVPALFALIRQVSTMAPRLTIDIPGPHPALPALFDAGFRIFYQATFCSNMNDHFFDTDLYIPADTITF